MFLGEPTEDNPVPPTGEGLDPKAILGDCCKTTITIKECHEFKNDIGMLHEAKLEPLTAKSFDELESRKFD